MSAETLRRAATLIRERAEAWREFETASERINWEPVMPFPVEPTPAGMHGAAWTPDVALAMADWLSMMADHAKGRGAVCGSCVDQALTVARAYLGEAS